MESQGAYSLVLETLQQAASQDVELLKPAEAKLQEWESLPGFYPVLLNIFSNHSNDQHVRCLAVLYFKNGINRYWRRNAPNAISDAEKTFLRQGLISNVVEPVNQIAVQLAVLISRIARLEFPREWPELIPTLLEALKSDNEICQHRALLILHHVVKVLSSKTLTGDRRVFCELAENVFGYILTVWNLHLDTFFQQEGNNGVGHTASLEKGLLALKVLRKLVVRGFKKPHEVEVTVLFLSHIFERIRFILEYRKKAAPYSQHIQDLCEKCVTSMMKVLLEVLEQHPFSYVRFIRPSLDFVYHYIFTPEGKAFTFERFTVQCMNLMKGILDCVEYRFKPGKYIGEVKDPLVLEAQNLISQFFTTERVIDIATKLVFEYFPFSKADLEMWDSDPELLATVEGGESSKCDIRPCTEDLFLELFKIFQKVLIPVVLELMRSKSAPVPPDDLSEILRKDAIYNVIGLTAFDLYNEVDFDKWFTSSLMTELKIGEPNYRILRARIVWLLGEWAGVNMSPELRPSLYECLVPALHPSEDMLVRLTAANTLKQVVDDFEFNREQFLPYFQGLFGLLYNLLREAKECDSKMQVLHVMSFIIERVGAFVRPFASSLTEYLQSLWQESAQLNMLRCAILTTLRQLIEALSSTTTATTSSPTGSPFALDPHLSSTFLISVIQLSTDLSQSSHLYLLEDGLDLWLSLVHNTEGLTPPVMQLFANLPPLLELSSENLKTCLQIARAYVMLAPDEVLGHYGSLLVATCCGLISELRPEGVNVILDLVETSLRASPTTAPQTWAPILPYILRCVFGADAASPAIPIQTMTRHLTVLARLTLCSAETFYLAVGEAGCREGVGAEQALDRVMEVWIDRMGQVWQTEQRKLLALGLLALMDSRCPAAMEKFCGVLLAVVQVLNDVAKTDGTGGEEDLLLTSLTSISSGDYSEEGESACDRRSRQLVLMDPVHTVALQSCFQEQVRRLQDQMGPAHFQELLGTVDVETMQQARAFLDLPSSAMQGLSCQQ